MNNSFEKLEQLLKLAAKDSVIVALVPSDKVLFRGYLELDCNEYDKDCYSITRKLYFDNQIKSYWTHNGHSFPIDLIIEEWDWFMTKFKSEFRYEFYSEHMIYYDKNDNKIGNVEYPTIIQFGML